MRSITAHKNTHINVTETKARKWKGWWLTLPTFIACFIMLRLITRPIIVSVIGEEKLHAARFGEVTYYLLFHWCPFFLIGIIWRYLSTAMHKADERMKVRFGELTGRVLDETRDAAIIAEVHRLTMRYRRLKIAHATAFGIVLAQGLCFAQYLAQLLWNIEHF